MTAHESKREKIAQLIGRWPSPVSDAEGLSILAQRQRTRRWLAGEIAQRAEWRATPLGELLPGLDQLVGSPMGDSLGVRSSNVLGRARLKTWPKLASATADWLREQPNLGTKSLEEILGHALQAWARAHELGELSGAAAMAEERAGTEGPAHLDATGPASALASLGEAVSTVVAWAQETRGLRDTHAALGAARDAEETLPQTVRDALDALSDVEPSKSARHRYSLADAFTELEEKDPVAFDVYRKRQLEGGRRPTLDELGKNLGVTRERVRQLEGRFKTLLESRVHSGGDWPVGAAAERIRLRFGPLLRADELPEVQLSVDRDGTVFSDAQYRMALLLRLSCDYRVSDDWLVAPHLQAETDRLLSRLTESGPASLGDACLELSRLGVREELQVPWIENRKEVRVLGDVVVRWGRSMRDKAVAILEFVGEPLELEDLFARIGEKKNFRAFKQQVQGDERIRRRGLKLYGLADWGGEEYTTIVDEMTEELERHGGLMDLSQLARVLADNFGVAESSVHMYAGGAQFEVDDSGQVRRRTGKAPVPPTRPLAVSRRCFRRREGWAFKRTVDHDVLRGSGGGIPAAFAKELGLAPGESRTFGSKHGDLHFSWRSHMTHVGSLRAIAEELGAREGDHLFLTITGAEALDFAVFARRDCTSESGWNRLALECGREAKGKDSAQQEVAEALGFDPEEPDLDIAIRMRFEERGEKDLAELVPRIDRSRGGDVLDMLASLGD